MIKNRRHKFTHIALCLVVMASMMIPTQELMLWCTMMGDDSSAIQTMTMDHNMSSISVDHCDSDENSKSDTQSSTQACDDLEDCDCLEIQSNKKNEAFLTLQASTSKIKLSSSVLKNLDQLHTNHDISPPPIWRYSSYSPPTLFLVNESFLI